MPAAGCNRTDAAKLIGENLHTLPGRDGKPLRMFQFSKVGHAPALQDQITQRALDVGNRIIHLLEAHGYSIVHHTDPAPGDQDPGDFPHVVAHCQHCAEPILYLAHLTSDIDQKGRFHSKLHRTAIEGAGLNHACWGEPTIDAENT